MQDDRKHERILFIDGHGETAGFSFRFRRPMATQCHLHSFTFEGVEVQISESNRNFQKCIANHPNKLHAPPVQTTSSRCGSSGVELRDRILSAPGKSKDAHVVTSQWFLKLPPTWTTDVVNLPGHGGRQVQCFVSYSWSSHPSPIEPWKSAPMVLIYINPTAPKALRGEVLLSTIIDHFNTNAYDIVWMACRA